MEYCSIKDQLNTAISLVKFIYADLLKLLNDRRHFQKYMILYDRVFSVSLVNSAPVE